MAIRRFRDHFVEQNWFAVVLDVLIVVLGVFLGIQVNNWNEGRLERQQGRDYRAMLVEDLNTNLSDLAMRKHYYQWVRAEALATLADLNRPSRDLNESFLLEAYQATQIQPWALKHNTYDQILAMGGMGRLGDPLLRDRVANYYVGVEVTGANMTALPQYREILRRVMPYAVQQSIRAKCNERIEVDDRGATHIVTPTACALGLDPVTVRQAVTQVHDWPGLALDLNRWLVDLDQKLLSVDTLASRAQQLKTRLEQAGN
jgi:hypothetical protein